MNTVPPPMWVFLIVYAVVELTLPFVLHGHFTLSLWLLVATGLFWLGRRGSRIAFHILAGLVSVEGAVGIALLVLSPTWPAFPLVVFIAHLILLAAMAGYIFLSPAMKAFYAVAKRSPYEIAR